MEILTQKVSDLEAANLQLQQRLADAAQAAEDLKSMHRAQMSAKDGTGIIFILVFSGEENWLFFRFFSRRDQAPPRPAGGPAQGVPEPAGPQGPGKINSEEEKHA